jgi:hypothetical protein
VQLDAGSGKISRKRPSKMLGISSINSAWLSVSDHETKSGL